MRIRTRMCVSLDGSVTTPDGRPVQLADPPVAMPRVFVLGSHRPEGTPAPVVVEHDPARLLEHMRDLGDIHLVGGPTTVDTFHRLGALDLLGLIVVPVFVGDGVRLALEAAPTLQEERRLPAGAVELVYSLA